MTEPTPVYGLVTSTRKPAARSASDMSRAITTLEGHHELEESALHERAGSFARAIDADPSAVFTDGQRYSWHNMRISDIAARLRSDRDQLLQLLLPLRTPLADILVEAQSLLPENVVFAADVEPRPLEPPPKVLTGVDLTLPEELRVLHETLRWAQRLGRDIALGALGPCYALARLIEYPTTPATMLHDDLEQAHTQLQKFVVAGLQ